MALTHTHCPVCEFRLRGDAREGYRCVRCHARYSPRHVRRLRVLQFRQLIARHFGPRVEERQTTLIVEDTDGAITAAIADAQSPHEEEFLDLSDLVAHVRAPRTTDEPRVVTDAARFEYDIEDAPTGPGKRARTRTARSAKGARTKSTRRRR